MTTPQLCLTCLVFLLYHCCHGGLLEPLALGGGRTPEVFSGRRAMVLVVGRAMVGMGGGTRLFFSFLVSSLVFFFGMQVWEERGDDHYYYVDAAWWPHNELRAWQWNSRWDDWGYSWEELVGMRAECNTTFD